MIIPFRVNYDSIIDRANAYLTRGLYEDALREAYVCHSLSPSSQSYLLFAEIYFATKDYALSLDCAFSAFAFTTVQPRTKALLYRIIFKDLNEMRLYLESLYYAGKSLREYDLPNEDTFDAIHRLYNKLSIAAPQGDESEKNELKLVSEERNEYNIKTFWQGTMLKDQGDIDGAIHLFLSMYPNSDCYEKSRLLLAHCYYISARIDKSVEVNKETFLRNNALGSIIYEISMCGDEYMDLVRELLGKFDSTDAEEVMYAVSAAHIIGEKEIAYKLAKKLYDANPHCVQTKMLLGFTMWNNGDEQGKAVIYSGLSNARLRYPVDAIKRLKLPKDIALIYNELPVCLVERLVEGVRRKRTSFGKALLSENFRSLLVFLLSCEDNRNDCDFILDLLEEAATPEAAEVLKQVLLAFKGFTISKIKAMAILLTIQKKGYVFVTNGSILSRKRLILPTSYPLFSVTLKHAYEFAFGVTCCLGEGIEKKLSMFCEDVFFVYDNLPGFFTNDEFELGLAMAYSFLPEDGKANGLYELFGKSPTSFSKKIALLKHIVGADDFAD